MGRKIDLTNQKFHMLTPIKSIGKNKHGITVWLCKCDCGKETVVPTSHIKNGITKSCGCYSRQKTKERATKHGMSGTKLYKVWLNMKIRCYCEKSVCYPFYGAKGITVCDEWHKFIPFMEWAFKNGYEERLVIDRIDWTGNYEPSNCRWVTQKENNNNTSKNVFVTWQGKTKTLSQWAETLGINYGTMKTRYENGDRGDKLFRSVRPKRKHS